MSRTIVILAGGLSHERDVSIRSGRRVAEALRAIGESVTVHDLDASLLGDLAASPPDCVIPLLHGASGEDGSLRDVLDSLGIPYVGSVPMRADWPSTRWWPRRTSPAMRCALPPLSPFPMQPSGTSVPVQSSTPW